MKIKKAELTGLILAGIVFMLTLTCFIMITVNLAREKNVFDYYTLHAMGFLNAENQVKALRGVAFAFTLLFMLLPAADVLLVFAKPKQSMSVLWTKRIAYLVAVLFFILLSTFLFAAYAGSIDAIKFMQFPMVVGDFFPKESDYIPLAAGGAIALLTAAANILYAVNLFFKRDGKKKRTK